MERKFQIFCGIIGILIGLCAVFMCGIGEGFIFVVIGIYMMATKEIIVGPMK